MSDIKEGDWVVTQDVPLGEAVVTSIGRYIFMEGMAIKEPRKVTRDPASSWFTINHYSYHPDWLIKVNQDGTPIEWSWLTELGW